MSLSSSMPVTGLGLVLLALASAAAKVVQASPSSADLPCIDQWTGPSANNTFDCSMQSIQDFLAKPEVAGMFVPAAIGILYLIPFSCIFLFGRYCCNCCGSSKMRPNSFCGGKCCGSDPDDELPDSKLAEHYSPCCIRITKIFTLVFVALAVVGVVCSIVGAAKFNNGAQDAGPTVDRVADWAIGLSLDTKAAVADPNDPNSFPPGFDANMFTDVSITIDKYRDDIRKLIDDISPTVKTITLIIGYVSIAPALVLLLPFLAALCNIRKCLPLLFILLSYLFQFVYFIFSTVCLLIFFAFAVLYSDITATDVSKKSLLQWYMIPVCERDAPFESAKANIDQMEKDSSEAGCVELLKVCENSSVWVPLSDQIFYCNLSNPATDCQSLAAFNAVVESMYVKPTVPQACGPDIANENCTIRRCANNCTNADAKSASAEAVKNLDTAIRVLNAYETILEPFLSCSAFVKEAVNSGLEGIIMKIRDSAQLLAAGSLCLSVGLFLAVIIGFLGQKRFIDRDALMSDTMYDIGNQEDTHQYTYPPAHPMQSTTSDKIGYSTAEPVSFR